MICFRAIARWKSGDVCEELTSLERKIRCKPGSEMSVALLHQSRGHSFQLISVSLDKMSRHPSVWRWPTWIDGERQVVNMISPLVAIVEGGKFARARKLRIWGARLRYTSIDRPIKLSLLCRIYFFYFASSYSSPFLYRVVLISYMTTRTYDEDDDDDQYIGE